MQRETIPGFADFVSGTRRIRMDMVRPVPNLIKVLDRYVACFEYDGVTHQCVRCGGTGHYAVACTTPKCSWCDLYGHETCEAPCALCQGDHVRSQCCVKSFAAAVAGRTPASTTENAHQESVGCDARCAPSLWSCWFGVALGAFVLAGGAFFPDDIVVLVASLLLILPLRRLRGPRGGSPVFFASLVTDELLLLPGLRRPPPTHSGGGGRALCICGTRSISMWHRRS
ncbi:hypothetical protein HPB48_021971 [Haemaphysalis longicornis]|uniref:CCHC-type domain-containing protein n=1 Tax=Haemaphysalis longicornis TaxID=44386 RepID=A0A9J6G9Z7_HAELO|nr:hypothetical protein HPB48_021971 [Haemaphysalis longicornis]